jgi:DNA-binding MarR family transcriptional regulator
MKRREELVRETDDAGRVLSTAAVLFHTVLAAKQGLSATDEKALDLIDRFGPITARDLSKRSGLAPASVTGLIDRLERKGFVRRLANPKDGRSILVEIDYQQLAQHGHYFDDFVGRLHELYESYSDEQLETIIDFMTRAARCQEAATLKLSE